MVDDERKEKRLYWDTADTENRRQKIVNERIEGFTSLSLKEQAQILLTN